jgi:hypothetical protein
MAAFNGFNGDYASLQHILKTLDAKSYLIPNVSSNGSLQVSALGEVAYFYTRSTSTADSANVGEAISYAAKGGKRIDISLTSALQIGAIIPNVNAATVSADLVADKVIQETLQQMNLWHTAAITAIEAGAEVKTYTHDANAYAAILEGIKAFKVDNKANGLKPTAVLVSSTFWAELMQTDAFLRSTPVSDLAVVEGEIRKVAGAYIIEVPDLVADFVVLHAEGVAAPINVKSLVITDATPNGYPGGTLIAGEIGYGFKVVDGTDDLSLGSGYLVAKYTEASGS